MKFRDNLASSPFYIPTVGSGVGKIVGSEVGANDTKDVGLHVCKLGC